MTFHLACECFWDLDIWFIAFHFSVSSLFILVGSMICFACIMVCVGVSAEQFFIGFNQSINHNQHQLWLKHCASTRCSIARKLFNNFSTLLMFTLNSFFQYNIGRFNLKGFSSLFSLFEKSVWIFFLSLFYILYIVLLYHDLPFGLWVFLGFRYLIYRFPFLSFFSFHTGW